MNAHEWAEWIELCQMDGRGIETYFGRASNGGRGSASISIGRDPTRLATIELGAHVTTSKGWES